MNMIEKERKREKIKRKRGVEMTREEFQVLWNIIQPALRPLSVKGGGGRP